MQYVSCVHTECPSSVWEVIVSVILSKKVYMWPILNGFRDRAITLYNSLDLPHNILLPFHM
jgi:hypothetical protein